MQKTPFVRRRNADWRADIVRTIKVCAAAVCVFTLGACISMGGSPPVSLPDWAVQPPKDSQDALYGVGEGHDLDTAKRNALRDAASKLRVVVAGSVESRTSVRNDQVDRSAATRVSAEVQKTEFKNFSLEKSANSPNGVVALVKVDRREFVQNTKDRIATLFTQIDKEVDKIDSRPPIEQFVILKRVRPDIATAQSYLQLLTGADLSQTERTQSAKLDDLLNRSDRIGDTLVLYVRARGEDSDIASIVSNFLTDQGMRTRPEANGAQAFVEISSQSKGDEIQGSKMVRLNVSIVVRDANQQAIAGQDYVVSGSSISDFRSARQQALLKLQDDLKKAGPVKGLGFKFR